MRRIAREVERVLRSADEFRECAESLAAGAVARGALPREDRGARGVGSVSRRQAVAGRIHIDVPRADFLGSRDATNRCETAEELTAQADAFGVERC